MARTSHDGSNYVRMQKGHSLIFWLIASCFGIGILSPRKKAAKKVRQIPQHESNGKWRTVWVTVRNENSSGRSSLIRKPSVTASAP